MRIPWSRGSVPLCAALAWSCSSVSNDTQGSPSTSVPTCAQPCQDDTVGYAVDDTMWLLWNENLAGQPSGNQNLSVQCPLGGSAKITGTTGVASNGIDTIHLTLDLQSCGNSNISYSLAFSGPLSWDGSFGSGRANAVTFKSTALGIEGSIRRYDMPQISETCAASFTDTFNSSSSNQSGWLVGALCGRAVSQ